MKKQSILKKINKAFKFMKAFINFRNNKKAANINYDDDDDDGSSYDDISNNSFCHINVSKSGSSSYSIEIEIIEEKRLDYFYGLSFADSSNRKVCEFNECCSLAGSVGEEF